MLDRLTRDLVSGGLREAQKSVDENAGKLHPHYRSPSELGRIFRKMPDKKYPVIILGGGPAGAATAMYLLRRESRQ